MSTDTNDDVNRTEVDAGPAEVAINPAEYDIGPAEVDIAANEFGLGRRLHVALRESIDRPGGLNTYVKLLAQGQEALGYHVEIAHLISRAGGYESRVSQARAAPAEDLSESDVVHLHMAYAAAAFRRSVINRKRIAAATQVVHFHGPWSDEGRLQGDSALRRSIKRRYERREYHRHSLFIADSSAFGALLQTSFGIPERQIRVVHPGVDTVRFTSGDQQQARQRLGQPNGPFTFACVRRLEPRMGIDRAIKALVHVADTRLIVAGTGSQRHPLESLSQRIGVGDRVSFLGRVPEIDLPTVYQAADAGLVPTVSLEGFGMVVLEAMACGIPVIATTNGGLAEAMGPFADHWLVPPDDVGALADRMIAARDADHDSAAFRAYAESRSPVRMAAEIGAAVGSMQPEPPRSGAEV